MTERLRNLVYHIWPVRKNNNWKWNVEQLVRRVELFNGVRSVAVALDDAAASLDEVKDAFCGVRVDNWITRPNNPRNREGATFAALMDTLPRNKSCTFYAHAKGVRHDALSITIPWTEMLYRSNVDHWHVVEKLLERFPVAGSFKRVGQFALPGNHCWHYSGTFFWFDNVAVFQKPDWHRLHQRFFACVEAWPANLFRSDEAGVIFGDNAGDLYQPEELQRQSQALEEWERRCSESK